MLKLARAGFTLVEVVIAIGILAIVVTVAYKALGSIAESKIALDDERDSLQIANTLLNRVVRELQMSIDNSPLLTSNFQGHNFYGEDNKIGRSDADLIVFKASEAGQYVPDGVTHSGTVQISYAAVNNPEDTGGRDDTLALVRTEIPDILPLDLALKNQMVFPITKNLLSFDLAYFDNNSKEWQSEWKDSRRLPALVRVKIELLTDRGKKMSFTTSVPVKRGI